MKIKEISWVGLLTEDLEVAAHFFAGPLGLTLDLRDDEKGIVHFRPPSGQLIEVYGPSNRERKEKYRRFDGPVPGFEVGNVAAARREMEGRGVTFITGLEATPEGDMWSFFLGPEDRLCTIQAVVRRFPEPRGLLAAIARFDIPVRDLETTTRFFQETMELPPADSHYESARFWLPGGHLVELLGPGHERAALSRHIIPGFAVAGLTAARRELEGQGVGFIPGMGPPAVGESLAYFHGPDGVLFSLWSRD